MTVHCLFFTVHFIRSAVLRLIDTAAELLGHLADIFGKGVYLVAYVDLAEFLLCSPAVLGNSELNIVGETVQMPDSILVGVKIEFVFCDDSYLIIGLLRTYLVGMSKSEIKIPFQSHCVFDILGRSVQIALDHIILGIEKGGRAAVEHQRYADQAEYRENKNDESQHLKLQPDLIVLRAIVIRHWFSLSSLSADGENAYRQPSAVRYDHGRRDISEYLQAFCRSVRSC